MHPAPNVRDDREAPLLIERGTGADHASDFWKSQVNFRKSELARCGKLPPTGKFRMVRLRERPVGQDRMSEITKNGQSQSAFLWLLSFSPMRAGSPAKQRCFRAGIAAYTLVDAPRTRSISARGSSGG
jgi:hypothetical protein